MIVEFAYQGQSAVVQGLESARMGFATNSAREAAFFRGTLGRPYLFREALGALFEVVTSDLKYRPRDRAAFRAWMDEQDARFVASLSVKGEAARKRMEELSARRAELDAARHARLAPFYAARRAYFDHVWQDAYELNYLLDPVVTVHPDELFFEAFSKDESSYARVGVRYDLFSKIHEFACGTTNIDFSAKLAGELDRVRSYRATEFDVAPAGIGIQVGDAPVHKEKKIDVPDSWVNGFLQVQSAMSMSLTRLSMAPIDLYNLSRFLRLHKAKKSPRSMRFELAPGKRPRVVFEPWEHAIELSGEAHQHSSEPLTVRTWGRDRLKAIARLLPVAQKVDVYLLGLGLPSVWVIDLGEVNFTLALSGWTDNDWTGGAKFDLLTRRLTTSKPAELMHVYEALKTARSSRDDVLAGQVGLSVEKTRSMLSHLCQVGRAMFDLKAGKYRHRDLFLAPFTLQEAATAVKPAVADTGKAAEAARELYGADDVRIIMRQPFSKGFKLSGNAKAKDGSRVRPQLVVDHEGKILEGSCTCSAFKSKGLTAGPCEHLLGLRLAHMARVELESS